MKLTDKKQKTGKKASRQTFGRKQMWAIPSGITIHTVHNQTDNGKHYVSQNLENIVWYVTHWFHWDFVCFYTAYDWFMFSTFRVPKAQNQVRPKYRSPWQGLWRFRLHFTVDCITADFTSLVAIFYCMFRTWLRWKERRVTKQKYTVNSKLFGFNLFTAG